MADRPDLDALADRAAGDSPEELTEDDCQHIARILRAVAAAPGPGWVVAAEFPDDRYRVTRTANGWALWTSDDPSFT